MAGTLRLLLFARQQIGTDTELLYNYGDHSRASIAAFPWLAKEKRMVRGSKVVGGTVRCGEVLGGEVGGEVEGVKLEGVKVGGGEVGDGKVEGGEVAMEVREERVEWDERTLVARGRNLLKGATMEEVEAMLSVICASE